MVHRLEWTLAFMLEGLNGLYAIIDYQKDGETSDLHSTETGCRRAQRHKQHPK